MVFDDRKHIVVEDLSEELFKKVIGYCFVKYGFGGPGCVRMITEDAEELQLSGKELNSLDYYTEWSKLFPVLRYFTYDGIRVDFSKDVKRWKVVMNEFNNTIVIRTDIFNQIIAKAKRTDIKDVVWDDELVNYAKSIRNEDKTLMLVTVRHPFDTQDTLGVFDNVEELKKACTLLMEKSTEVVEDMSNLHVYRCPVNKMIGEFYPSDYSDPNSTGFFAEEQTDILYEIFEDDFLEEMKEKQRQIVKDAEIKRKEWMKTRRVIDEM